MKRTAFFNLVMLLAHNRRSGSTAPVRLVPADGGWWPCGKPRIQTTRRMFGWIGQASYHRYYAMPNQQVLRKSAQCMTPAILPSSRR